MIVCTIDSLHEQLVIAEAICVAGSPMRVYKDGDEFVFAPLNAEVEGELLIEMRPDRNHITTPLGDEILKSIGLGNINAGDIQ